MANITNLIHGMSGTRPYYIWRGMKQRIDNPNRKDYKDYGGRGIKYSQPWKGFLSFWEDMRGSYGDTLTLDRIDPNGNYCKENCRWIPQPQQARCHRKHPKNTSNVTGVHYRENQDCWRATWCDGSGKRLEKSFYCKKLGYDNAFNLACNYRKLMIAELEALGFEYSEFHGK